MTQYDIVFKDVKKEFIVKEEFSMFFSAQKEVVTPIDNVSFKIKKGEIVGIIGPNGSGKTTLLRLIGKIFSPTKGSIEISPHSRVALLSMYQTFDGELTAVDNVFLQGALYNIPREVIREKLNRIFVLADLLDFKDVSLKKYSDGMRMRLAFAIALTAQADIYLLDEILSVGDEDFQRRSFEYVQSLKKTGKTVVIVSHDVHRLKVLSDRLFYLSGGKLIATGNPSRVIGKYMQDVLIFDKAFYSSSLKRLKKTLLEKKSPARYRLFSHVDTHSIVRQELLGEMQRLEYLLHQLQQLYYNEEDNLSVKKRKNLFLRVKDISYMYGEYFVVYARCVDDVPKKDIFSLRNKILYPLDGAFSHSFPPFSFYRKLLSQLLGLFPENSLLKEELEYTLEREYAFRVEKKDPALYNVALSFPSSLSQIEQKNSQDAYSLQQVLTEENPLRALVGINYDTYLNTQDVQERKREFEKLSSRFVEIYSYATSSVARFKALFHLKSLFDYELNFIDVEKEALSLKGKMNHYICMELHRLEQIEVKYSLEFKKLNNQLKQKTLDSNARYQLQAFRDALSFRIDRVKRLINILVNEQIDLYDKNALILGKGAGTHTIELKHIDFVGKNGKVLQQFASGDSFCIKLTLMAKQDGLLPHIGVAIDDVMGNRLLGPNNKDCMRPIDSGEQVFELILPSLPLATGKYYVTVGVYNTDLTEMYDYHYRKFSFSVISPTTIRGEILSLPFKWK